MLINKHINKNSLVMFILLGVSPLLSMLYVIRELLRRNEIPPILSSIPIAIIIVSMPWLSDTLNNFNSYLTTDYFTSGSFYINSAQTLNYYFSLEYSFFYFLTVCFMFYVKLIVINKYNSRALTDFYFFLAIVVLCLSFRDIADLNRTYLGASLFLLGYLLFEMENKKITAIFLFALSFLVHSFCLIPVAVFFACKFIPKIKLRYLFITFIVSLQFTTILDFIISITPFFKNLEYYIHGEAWGKMSLLPGNIALRLLDFSVMASILYFYRSHAKENIFKLLFILAMLAILFVEYRTFYERITMLLYVCLPIVCFLKTKLNLSQKIIVISALLARSLFYNVYTHGYVLYENTGDLAYYHYYMDNLVRLLYYPNLLYINSFAFWDNEIFRNYF